VLCGFDLEPCSNLFSFPLREIGEDNIFLFGNLAEDVEDLRHAHFYGEFHLDPQLKRVFDAIRSGTFGDAGQFSALVDSIVEHGDYYLVSDDFKSYLDTQKLIDEAYRDQESWLTKTITAVARMGFFSSDRCIDEYAEMIWNVEVGHGRWHRYVEARTDNIAV
jgi:starch phosphorylase